MKNITLIAFLLGVWIGGSLLIFGVVGYSFPGVVQSIKNNQKLAERIDFDPSLETEKKTSVLWVYTGELNRTYFAAWNYTQLVLGALTLLSIFFLFPSRGLLAVSILAFLLVLVMTFYLTPEIISQGRALDFLPRDTPPPGMERFDMLHQIYTWVDVSKVILLSIGVFFVMRKKPASL